MATKYEISKSLLSPPGDTIQEHIDFVGMSQAELAERMGRPKEKINDIIKGREPISTTTAFQLEKVLGIPADFWMNREKTYRKELYKLHQKEWFEKEKDWLVAFPIKIMKKHGWLPNTNEKHILMDSLLKFFSIASADDWKRIYMDEEVSVAFRVSLAHTNSPHAISAWLRRGEIQSKEIIVSEFNKTKFHESLSDIKELAYLMPEDFARQLQIICSNCGVAVVFTPLLPKAPISGATRWFHNKPMIQLSGRFKTNDHFWFTFFHEAAHIILHGKKDIFLENVKGAIIDHSKEEEANVFAEKILLTKYELKEIFNNPPFTDEVIQYFAKKFRTPAGVIVGRLQYLKLIPFSMGNNFRTKIDLFGEN
jgi:HTH-type transcriptional regulator/antitoxin HigA